MCSRVSATRPYRNGFNSVHWPTSPKARRALPRTEILSPRRGTVQRQIFPVGYGDWMVRSFRCLPSIARISAARCAGSRSQACLCVPAMVECTTQTAHGRLARHRAAYLSTSTKSRTDISGCWVVSFQLCQAILRHRNGTWYAALCRPLARPTFARDQAVRVDGWACGAGQLPQLVLCFWQWHLALFCHPGGDRHLSGVRLCANGE